MKIQVFMIRVLKYWFSLREREKREKSGRRVDVDPMDHGEVVLEESVWRMRWVETHVGVSRGKIIYIYTTRRN